MTVQKDLWKENVQFIKPDWPCPPNIFAVSTTRMGGTSKGPFAGFNLGTHVGDEQDAVMRHRTYLEECFSLAPVVWLTQVHGDEVLSLDGMSPSDASILSYDASYTTQSHLTCAVMTADCLPVLITNRQGSCVAAVHCGWRSLAKGILSQVLAKMSVKGTKPEDLMVWLGPAIGPKSFEVGHDVLSAFCALDPKLGSAFVKKSDEVFTEGNKEINHPMLPEKWLCDIYKLARMILNTQGVTAIYGGGYCTFNENRFYSYRRDKETGRMASLIAIR